MENKVLRAVPLAVIMLLAGFAVARFIPAETPAAPPTVASGAAVHFDDSQPIEQRLLTLERALGVERQARQLLQEELVYLTEEIDRLRPAAERSAATAASTASAESEESGPRRSFRRNSREPRSEQLLAAGFSPARAEWIAQRESQLELDMLEARYEAQRSGDFSDLRQARDESAKTFRDELGAEDYERYLEATGRSTSVTVSSVLDGSPAQTAGLRPGDRIVSYAGNRTYSMSDLNDAIVQGQPGQTVLVDIVRDGIPMQVALPRGAVGIMGGRQRR
ncbi:MAG: PDZ domain-containing protein [Woeseia sp.]